MRNLPQHAIYGNVRVRRGSRPRVPRVTHAFLLTDLSLLPKTSDPNIFRRTSEGSTPASRSDRSTTRTRCTCLQLRAASVPLCSLSAPLSVSLSRTHVRVLRVFLLFIPDVCAETFPTLVCPTSSITRSLPTRTEITDNQILVRPRPRRFFGGVGFLRTVRPMHSRAAIFLCPLLPNYHGCAHGCFKAS